MALKDERISYSTCHEYSSNAKLSRARQDFIKGAAAAVVVVVVAPAAVLEGYTCMHRDKLSGAIGGQTERRLGRRLQQQGRAHIYTYVIPAALAAAAAAAAAAGDVPLLVATSRFCFYRRYRLSGAQRILFLGPPCSPEVYVHLLTESLPAAPDSAAAATTVTTPSTAAKDRRVEGAALCYFTSFHLQALESLMPFRQALQLLQAPQGRIVALS